MDSKDKIIDLLERKLAELKEDYCKEDDEDFEDELEVDFLLESIFDNAEIHGDIVLLPKDVMDSIIDYLNKDGDWEIDEDE